MILGGFVCVGNSEDIPTVIIIKKKKKARLYLGVADFVDLT